ncbi:hypothetical protein Hanom_Chr09g00855541 [Helianthus anomalus]
MITNPKLQKLKTNRTQYYYLNRRGTALVSFSRGGRHLESSLLQNRALDGVIWVLRRCFQHRLKAHWFKIMSY